MPRLPDLFGVLGVLALPLREVVSRSRNRITVRPFQLSATDSQSGKFGLGSLVHQLDPAVAIVKVHDLSRVGKVHAPESHFGSQLDRLARGLTTWPGDFGMLRVERASIKAVFGVSRVTTTMSAAREVDHIVDEGEPNQHRRDQIQRAPLQGAADWRPTDCSCREGEESGRKRPDLQTDEDDEAAQSREIRDCRKRDSHG